MVSKNNDSEQNSEEETISLEIRELNLREKEYQLNKEKIKLDHNLEKLKIITTGIVATLVPAIVTAVIQNQQVEIERLSSERDYVNTFAEQALQSDLAKRLTFVEYLSTIAHSRDSRMRWERYKKRVEDLIEEEKAQLLRIEELRAKIEELKRSDNPADNREEIERYEEILAVKEAELRQFREDQLITLPFGFKYYVEDPIFEGSSFTWEDATKGDRLPESQEIVDNITKLAKALQEVEKFLGTSIEVTSWYRPPTVNAATGGASRSTHLSGLGADIKVQGMTSRQLYEKLDVFWGDRGALGLYSNPSLPLHIDVRGYRARWDNSPRATEP